MWHLRLLLALCLGMSESWAGAQDYPTKPVRLIVGVAPGGGVDTLTRSIAARLAESFKQTVVVDNRTGAGSSIATELTARATPDGHTLMMVTASLVIYPAMYRASYDPVRDFAPVTQVVTVPLLVVINPAVPAQTAGELITLAKGRPGTINYASSGSGSFIHLTGELFKVATGTDLVHIPYKGNAAVYPDLIAGQTQLGFTAISSAMPHVKSGRLRGLAVTSRARSKGVPEFPSLAEAGVPGFDVTQWYGVVAPAGTPRPVIDRLQREIAAVLQQPEVIVRLAMEGDSVNSSSAQFGQHIRGELDKWVKVIKQTGIRGE